MNRRRLSRIRIVVRARLSGFIVGWLANVSFKWPGEFKIPRVLAALDIGIFRQNFEQLVVELRLLRNRNPFAVGIMSNRLFARELAAPNFIKDLLGGERT